jgi:hypothetical protein
MKIKIVMFLMLLFIIIITMSAFSADPKWWTTPGIVFNPTSPSAGNSVTISCQLKEGQSAIDNLKIIAKIDGSKVWEQVYPHFNYNEWATISFTWNATAGSHTVEMIIDPDHTSGDTDYTNNNIQKSFSVAVTGTDVKWVPSTFKMTPANPLPTDLIEFYIEYKVELEPVTQIYMQAGLDGAVVVSGNDGDKPVGAQRPLSFKRALLTGQHTVFFKLDPNQTTNDVNRSNNDFTYQFTVQDIGPVIYWKDGEFQMTPPNPNYGDKITFKHCYWIDAKPTPTIEFQGLIDNVLIQTRSHPGTSVPNQACFAFTWNAFTPGIHKVKMLLDPNNITGEQNTADNSYEHSFTIPAPDPGTMPNITVEKAVIGKIGFQLAPKINSSVSAEPLKEGDNVVISYITANRGNQITKPFVLKVYEGTNNVYSALLTLKPGETVKKSINHTLKCGVVYKIIADVNNEVAESNEMDNAWKSQPCQKNIIILKTSKKQLNVPGQN